MKQLMKRNVILGDYFHDTELNQFMGGDYILHQESTQSQDDVVLDRYTAVNMARAILKNEGIKCD